MCSAQPLASHWIAERQRTVFGKRQTKFMLAAEQHHSHHLFVAD